MDRTELDRRIEQHGRNIVSGNFEELMNDFSEEVKPGVPKVAQLLPQPLEKAEVLDLLVFETSAAAVIRYSNATNQALVIESVWEERNGRLIIVAAGPVLPGQPRLHALLKDQALKQGE